MLCLFAFLGCTFIIHCSTGIALSFVLDIYIPSLQCRSLLDQAIVQMRDKNPLLIYIYKQEQPTVTN